MTTTEILTGIKNWVLSKLNLKQDVINDLAAIRSGSQAGSTAVQPSDLSSYFNDASYDTSTHRINFYHGQNIVAYVDASPFIVDGMVDDVRIENGYLVIDFNTASGKQDISIPLTDIFDLRPVKATYEEMTKMRDQGKLIPGQYYQITDYVTTVNEPLNPNARSAGHQFDILVRADSATVLNEQAWAVKHDGDTYFDGARLEAWQLKYRLDNVQWSKQTGTYVTDEENGYAFQVIGDITLSGHTYKLLQGFDMYVDAWSDYALMETVAEGEQIICYYGDPEEFDPKEPEVVGTASGVEEVTEAGKGIITWMKDEWNNECPYDFKNIQYKRYMTTDSVSGRDGLGGKYMVAAPDNCPRGLSVEDTKDFIWAYTFSSDNAGGEQTDYSLTAEHQVHDNVMKANGSELNNITFFGNYCYSMSFGNSCSRMSFGNGCYNMSFGNYCYDMSFGNSCSRMSFGNLNNNMSFGNNCYSMSFGNSCYDMSFGNDCRNGTITESVQYVDIFANTWNFQLLNGLAGTASSHLAPSFATQKAYTQVACKKSSGQLKIYVPGDLV